MTNTPLCLLARKHGTDKKKKHNYTPTYYELLKARAVLIRSVLEIGISRGASLRMWEEYFPNAKVFGLDCDPTRKISAGRIRSFISGQTDADMLRKIVSEAGGALDFVVDDGSHDPDHQVTTASILLPFLSRAGIYVIEDVKDQSIVEKMPGGYKTKIVRTADEHFDSVLIIIRRKWLLELE